MQVFTSAQLLDLWETARTQHPLDRALTILATAAPGSTRDALADLSLGERDSRLLQLRTRLLGSRAEGFAECPGCGEALEFPIETGGFFSGEVATNRDATPRPVTTRDLAAIATAPDDEAALASLLQRLAAPNESLENLSAALLAADPRAEILLQVTCPACAHEWQLLFEIAEFFWQELSVLARRLLREIDALARAYGWSEREILGLSPQRRQSYLELIAA